ncbi:MAG TPA: response regulator, partial [bacterium]|nr:response regulator [bacterium]
MEVSKSRVFCPACGLKVEPALGMEGDHKTISCSLCDLLLESRASDAPAPAAAPAGAFSGMAPMPPPSALQTVIAAEDTEPILRSLVDLLTRRGIAKNVLPAANGEDCLIQYHRALAHGMVPQLLVLDVNMPILNGINAAIAVRAAERAFGITTPTPVLFFTASTCDESFKRVLQFTAPARYLNKGA